MHQYVKLFFSNKVLNACLHVFLLYGMESTWGDFALKDGSVEMV